MPTHPISGARYPTSGNATNVPQDIQNAVSDLSTQVVPRYATTAARDAAFAAWTSAGNTMATGMQCYVVGIGRMQYVSGTWRAEDLQVYSTLAARDTAIPSPVRGDQCICLGTLMVHNGTKWRFTLGGTASGNCDANGFFSFPHGGGQAPVSWVITPAYQATDALSTVIQILSSNNAGDATVLGCRAVRTDSNSYLGVNPVSVNWMAQF